MTAIATQKRLQPYQADKQLLVIEQNWHVSLEGRFLITKVCPRCQLELFSFGLMADARSVNKPTGEFVHVEMIDKESPKEIKVILLVDDLRAPMFGNKQKPKNGRVDVTFLNRGFDMLAILNDKDGKEVKWHYRIKRLPGEIDTEKCKASWKVDTGMVVINLIKKEERSWRSMLRNGLEQCVDSSSSDDEGVDVGSLQLDV